MKIRNGFVSNSSTSSFLCMTTKENHERAIEELSHLHRKIIQALISENEFLGIPVVLMSEISDAGGFCSNDIDHFDSDVLEVLENIRSNEDENDDSGYDGWNEIMCEAQKAWETEIKKEPTKVFEHSLYM